MNSKKCEQNLKYMIPWFKAISEHLFNPEETHSEVEFRGVQANALPMAD